MSKHYGSPICSLLNAWAQVQWIGEPQTLRSTDRCARVPVDVTVHVLMMAPPVDVIVRFGVRVRLNDNLGFHFSLIKLVSGSADKEGPTRRGLYELAINWYYCVGNKHFS